MKLIILLVLALISSISFSQKTELEVSTARKAHLEELNDVENGILTKEELEAFEGLDYFGFDSSYQRVANFRKEKGPEFEMATSTDRKPIYRKFGTLTFMLDGESQELNVYQNIRLRKLKEYRDYLFVPFKDKTCGTESYGGGRYLDLKKQKGKLWLIDFNLAYNPYCAYSYRYSCPIPPKENILGIYINAGEKTPYGH